MEFSRWYGPSELIQGVTQAAATRYMREVIKLKTGWSPKTMRAAASDLSTFFKWATAEGLTDLNPFYQRSLLIKESKRGKRKKERPWRNDELAPLFNGLQPSDQKWQLAAIALFSGMRREEICSTELIDIQDGFFDIPEDKTESAARIVPIHPTITPLIKHLTSTSTDGYLLSGLKRVDVNAKRGHSIGNRFSEFKNNKLGLRVVRFQDLRSNCVTALQEAEVPPLTIQQLVGHKSNTVTFDTYSGGVRKTKLQTEISKVSYGAIDGLVSKGLGRLLT